MSAVKPRHGDIPVIPNTDEKYTSMKIGKVAFTDSFQFMTSTLDSLSKNLADDQYEELMRCLKSDYRGNISLKDYFIAFAFNAKTFAVAILVFFFYRRFKISYQDGV